MALLQMFPVQTNNKLVMITLKSSVQPPIVSQFITKRVGVPAARSTVTGARPSPVPRGRCRPGGVSSVPPRRPRPRWRGSRPRGVGSNRRPRPSPGYSSGTSEKATGAASPLRLALLTARGPVRASTARTRGWPGTRRASESCPGAASSIQATGSLLATMVSFPGQNAASRLRPSLSSAAARLSASLKPATITTSDFSLRRPFIAKMR